MESSAKGFYGGLPYARFEAKAVKDGGNLVFSAFERKHSHEVERLGNPSFYRRSV